MTLLAAGGLEALQQMVIVGSAPFLLIVLGVAVAFWPGLSREPFPATGSLSDPGQGAEAVVAENGARRADREPVCRLGSGRSVSVAVTAGGAHHLDPPASPDRWL
jgi:choline-glycine betaine transporter